MAERIQAAELVVKVKIEKQEVLQGLREIGDAVVATGQRQVAPTAAESLKKMADVAKGATGEIDKLAEKQSLVRMDKLSSDIDVLSKRLEIAKQKLAEMATAENVSADKKQELEFRIQSMTARLNQMNGQLDISKDRLEKIRNPIVNLPDPVDKLAGRFSGLAEIAVGGFRRIGEAIVTNFLPLMGKAIGIAADFEQNMNVLQAASGANAVEMERLSSAADQLGSDLTLPNTSASDAATAMLELSKAGLNVNDTLNASRGVLQLSAAAQISNADAATYTANALNAFNLKGDQAVRVADLLAGAANASSANVKDLALGFQSAAFAFSSTGQDIETLATAIAALSKEGIGGSDAGTALKNAMLQMMAPTAEAAATMHQYGIQVRDAQGNMKPFIEIVGIFNEKLGGLNAAQREAALKTILQSDGMKAMIPLMALGTDGLEQMRQETTKQGAAADMASAQNKGLNGAVDGLKSQFETFMKNAITPLLPLMTNVVKGFATFVGYLADNVGPVITGLVDIINNAVIGFQAMADFVENNATVAMTVLAAAVGAFVYVSLPAMITGLAGMATSFAFTVVGALGASGALTTFAASAMAATAALGPFILLAGSLALVATAATMFDDLNKSMSDTSANLLLQKQWFTEGQDAIGRYNDMQGQATQQSKDTALALQEENAALAEGMQERAKWDSLGLTGIGPSIEELQQRRDKIKELTSELNTQLEADAKLAQQQGASLMAANAVHKEYEVGTGVIKDYAQEVVLLPEQIEALAKAESNLAKALGDVINTDVDFFADMRTSQEEHNKKLVDLQDQLKGKLTAKQREKIQEQINNENTAYADQLANAGVAYANQEEAQRQHLGRMLLDWVDAQTTLTGEQTAALKTMVGAKYGITLSAEELATGDFKDLMKEYADGKITLDELSSSFDTAKNKHVDLQDQINQQVDTKVTEVTTKFLAGGYGDPNTESAMKLYRADLDNIKPEAVTEVRAEAAQAEQQVAATKAQYEYLQRPITTPLTANATNALQNLNTVKTHVDNLVTPKYLSFKDNALEAEGRVSDLGQAVNNVPKTIDTKVNINTADAKADTLTLGADLALGIAQGITSRSGAILNAMKNSVNAAVLGTKAAAQIFSPSRLTASVIGSPLSEGVAVGMKSQESNVVNTFVDIIGKGVSEATVKAADGVSKIADTITKAIDAMTKLQAVKAPSAQNLATFSTGLTAMIQAFSNSISSVKGQLTDATTKYADIVSKIVDVVGKGVDSLNKLRGFVAPSRDAIMSFITALRYTVMEFSYMAEGVIGELDVSTTMFADVAMKVVDTVSKGVDALSKLNTFQEPTRESIYNFSVTLRDVVVDFWHRAQEISYTFDGSAELFADVASKAVDTISKGVDALSKLNTFTNPSRDALLSFSYTLRDVVADFWHRAQEVNYALDASTLSFAETASKALDTISKGVDALMKLDGFTSPSRDALYNFSITIRDVVSDFWHRSQEIDFALTESTTLFAETASTVVETISNGVEGLMQLNDFVSPTRESITAFAQSVRDVVSEFMLQMQTLNTDLLESTSLFAETGATTVETISGGVEAFLALQSYSGVPQAALAAFMADLEIAIRLMAEMSQRFDVEMVGVAADFAEKAGNVVQPIKDGVDAFTSLREYEQVASERMNAIFADLQLAMSIMIQVAQASDTQGVEAAAKFSESVKTVFDGLKSGIDALSALREYESVPQERVNAFMADFDMALGMISTLAGKAQEAESMGVIWRDSLTRFADAIKAGVSAVASLNGLAVNISANVNASGTVAPSGSGEAPADGSHAMGLDYVPFDGYRAIVHKGEAILTPEEAREWRSNQAAQQSFGVTETPVQQNNGITISGNTFIVKDNGMDLDELALALAQKVKEKMS